MRGERGFALIAALWLLVALSAVGLQFSLQARERRLSAANVLDEGRARAAAEAGLEHARARLHHRLQQAERLRGSLDVGMLADPWAELASLLPRPTPLGGAAYSVSLRDANAALHLNRAGEEEIRRLLAALRVDFGRADEIVQGILDWRDPDDLVRARGAEREFYLREGVPVLPRNGPFEEITELRHVRGMTPEVFERLRPHLTLLGTGQINLNTADPVVLATLPGIGDEAVAAILRFRRQGRRIGSLPELADQLSPGARAIFQESFAQLLSRTTMETREVEVWSEGSTEGGLLRSHLHALVVRAGSTTYVVWRRAG
jgi:general secretion pathway protein K